MRFSIGSLFCAFVLVTTAGFGQEPGNPLPAWSPGIFDIHQIHTGRGNAALMVFPDGTTALLDAGAVPDRNGLEIGPQRPNASHPPAEWIARYIRQFCGRNPATLDYAIVTHYHDDHMGALSSVAASIPVRVLIDRGMDPPPPNLEVVRRYFQFRKTFQGRLEVLKPGRADQVVPKRDGTRSAGFEVRNVAANGLVWTGRGDLAVSRFPQGWKQLPAEMQPSENHFSIALRIRYGSFDYFTGGDLPGVVLDNLPEWQDLETPVARAVGAVDAAVLNHHGLARFDQCILLANVTAPSGCDSCLACYSSGSFRVAPAALTELEARASGSFHHLAARCSARHLQLSGRELPQH